MAGSTETSTPDPARTTVIDRIADRVRRARRWQVFLLAFALMFGLSGAYALLTPIGGSPDERAHIVKAAGVVRGQGMGENIDGSQNRTFHIPRGISEIPNAINCTVFKETVPADCDFPIAPDHAEIIVTESSAGLYNPVYYALVGWPTLLSPSEPGIYGMRLVSAALTAAFFALALTCLSLLPRARLPLLAGLGMVTPTAAYLGGMVNPNLLEVSTVTAFAAALFAAVRLEATGALLWRLVAVMAVAGGLAVHARSLAPLWIFAAVLVVACVAGWGRFWRFLRRPVVLATVAVIAISTAIAVVVTLSTGTLGEMGDYPGQGTAVETGVRTMLWNFWNYVPPLVGTYGWNDTSIPSLSTDVVLAMVFALLAAAVVGRTGLWPRLGVLLAIACFIGIPALVQGISVTGSGYIWQGRYALAMWMILIMAASVVVSRGFERLSGVVTQRLVTLVLAVLACVHAAGMQHLLYRYGAGVHATLPEFWLRPEWTPFGVPMLVFVAASVLLAAAWFVGGRALVEMGDRHDPEGERRDDVATVPASPERHGDAAPAPVPASTEHRA